MNRHLILAISVSLFVSILLFSCTASEGAEVVVDVKELTVSFDPGRCTYDGPKAIRPGEIAITLDNHTDSLVDLRLSKFQEGKTWQELADSFKDSNQSISYPKWITLVSFKPVLSDLRVKKYNLEPGLYLISCTETLGASWAIWLASPLEVK
jgi:hypothetical protein